MTTLSIALFILALALIALPLLPRLNAFRRCFFPVLILLALGVCYSQKNYLNPMARLFFGEGFQQGWEAPGIEPNLDSDGDGLSDEIEKSGYFPRVIPLDATVFDRPEGAIDLWTGWAGTHEVAEWPLGEDFPIHTNRFAKAGVSQSGMLCFGGALNSTVPVNYPLANSEKNRLRRGIAQFAFFQGLNRIAPGAGSEVFYAGNRLVFKNVFLDDVNAAADAAVELFADGGLRFSYQGAPWNRNIGWHVGEGGLMVTDLTGGVTLELIAFPPTDPGTPDTDGDGANDYDELFVCGTDPAVPDFDRDADGFPDWLTDRLGHAPARGEWEELLACDANTNNCPDILEARANPAACGLVRIGADNGGDAPVCLTLANASIPLFPGENTAVVPVPWGTVFELPAGVGIEALPGSVLLRRAPETPRPRMLTAAPPPSVHYQIIHIGVEPVIDQNPFGQGGTVCAHAALHDTALTRTLSLRFTPAQGAGFTFEDLHWHCPGADISAHHTHATLSFSQNETTPGPLTVGGNLLFDSPSPWTADPFTLPPYAVTRCAPPKAPPIPGQEEAHEKENHTSCVYHIIPNHCCLHSSLCSYSTSNHCAPGCCRCPRDHYACPPENETCPFHAEDTSHCCPHSGCGIPHCPQCHCPGHTCPDRHTHQDPDNPEPPPAEKTLSGTTRLAALRIDNNDSDQDGTRDYHQPTRPKIDIDWKKLAFTISPHLPGTCCPCPEHSTGGTGYATAESHTIRALKTNGTPLTRIEPKDGDIYAQGLRPSATFFDQTLIIKSGPHSVTNHYTVGALALEPADRGTLQSNPPTAPWIIPCGDFYPLVVKSEVFTPGAFTLTHTGSPAFELWIPPATAEGTPDLYDPYAADFLAGAIPEGSRLFNSPLTGTEADFYDDFILPTNRVVWVRALEPGAATLTYTYHKTMLGVSIRFEDTLTVTALPPALLPDYDRNGAWDETDLTAASRKERFNFWRNDNLEKDDAFVNGLADWHDFFPVKLNLKEHLAHFSFEKYDYIIDSPGGALNIWSYSLTPDGARTAAGELNPGTEEMNAPRLENILNSGSLGKNQRVVQITLYPELLESIAANAYSHALLFEGRQASPSSALGLTIKEKNSDTVAFTFSAPVSIVEAHEMYHTIDLLAEAEERKAFNDSYASSDAPWGQDDQKHLLFIHGYNVNSPAARAWANDLFKRFYWSGSRAAFHAIHWYGFKSQGSALISDFSPNYHVNVENAFATATALAAYTRALPGQVTLAAHSLGNMVASSAICHHNARVDDYILLNPAVPLEAYHAQTDPYPNLVHSDWRPYVNATPSQERLLCSEWHTLFAATPEDPRNKLTWRGLFADKKNTRFHQFYSTGEEVVNNPPESLWSIHFSSNGVTFETPDQYSWATQELWKGRSYELWGDGWFTGSRLMGWGFNAGYEYLLDPFGLIFGMPSPQKAARDIGDADLVKKPFFRKNPSELFSDNDETAQAYAQTHRLRLLAHAIPARTSGAGGTAGAGFATSTDMNDAGKRNGWFRTTGEDPFNWKHSDIRNMPFINVKPIFQQIMTQCNLKGNAP